MQLMPVPDYAGVDNLTIKAPEVYNIEEQSADLASIKLPQNHVASGMLGCVSAIAVSLGNTCF